MSYPPMQGPYTGIRRKIQRSGGLSCSFCKRDQTEVKRLIAGPDVYICNDCIQECNEALEPDKESSTMEEVFEVRNRFTVFSLLFESLKDAKDFIKNNATTVDGLEVTPVAIVKARS